LGTLALVSPLDLAVRILDYRLSHTTTPVVQEIFKYCIALLRSKIAKTHKKVPSVVSPVSVSPSHYSVLSVDMMDCNLNCSVPSKGVPAKGLVLDVKSRQQLRSSHGLMKVLHNGTCSDATGPHPRAP